MSHNQWFYGPSDKEYLTLEKYNTLLYNKLDADNVNRTKKTSTVSDFINYNYNTSGYRGINFEKSKDFLAAGCSQTFGVGVQEEHVWTNVLSKKINADIPNLSIIGGSVGSIINNVYAYFKKFGLPKVLFLLLPDPYRMQIPTQRKYITSSYLNEEKMELDKSNKYLTYLYFKQSREYKIEKYQKMPFNLEQTLPTDIPFFYSMRSIENLIDYCDNLNIKLIWSSHDLEFNLMMSDVKYRHYVDSEEHMWSYEMEYGTDFLGFKKNIIKSSAYNNIKCHEDLRSLDPRIFEMGNDYVHFGIHRHQHMAETFERALND